MPQTVAPMSDTREPAPNRIRWTRQQREALREAGILTGRYELIDGWIIDKAEQKPAHRIAVILLRNWLIAVFGALFVQSQAGTDIGDADPEHNDPEPDAAVTAQPYTAYTQQHPGPADLLFVAEVSDTTLRFDRITKAALYARAGIVEYWVVDVNGRQIFVHRDPSPEGYRDVAAYAEQETLAPLARADAALRVAELLPPA